MARQEGFSLVEIAMALGILAFVLMAVLGLLGVGLDSSRQAQVDTMRATIARTILSRVISDLRTNTSDGYFDSFSSAPPAYFTYDGLESAGEKDRYYECLVEAAGSTSGLRPEAASNMRAVKVTVRYPYGVGVKQSSNVVHASVFRQN